MLPLVEARERMSAALLRSARTLRGNTLQCATHLENSAAAERQVSPRTRLHHTGLPGNERRPSQSAPEKYAGRVDSSARPPETAQSLRPNHRDKSATSRQNIVPRPCLGRD